MAVAVLKNTLLGGLWTALSILVPVIGVARPLPVGFISEREKLAYLMVFLALTFGFALGRNHKVKAFLHPQGLKGWNLFCGLYLYGSLYLTAILLCRRTGLALFNTYILNWSYGGLILTGLGAILYVRAALRADGRLWPGLVVMAAGLSITHLAWFPLLALPGLVVLAYWLQGPSISGDQTH